MLKRTNCLSEDTKIDINGKLNDTLPQMVKKGERQNNQNGLTRKPHLRIRLKLYLRCLL